MAKNSIPSKAVFLNRWGNRQMQIKVIGDNQPSQHCRKILTGYFTGKRKTCSCNYESMNLNMKSKYESM